MTVHSPAELTFIRLIMSLPLELPLSNEREIVRINTSTEMDSSIPSFDNLVTRYHTLLLPAP